MRRLTTLALAILMILTVGQAALGFGRFGATDLMYVPTSGTLADGAFGLWGNFAGGTSMVGMDLGLATNLELGVTAWIGDGWTEASLRGKFHLLSEKSDGFGLAVGIQDMGLGYVSPYVVAGKTLGTGLQGYLGVGGGAIDGVFFGLNKNLGSMRGASLFLEYDSHNLNVGGRFKIANNLGLDIGIVDLDNVVVGISFVNRF